MIVSERSKRGDFDFPKNDGFPRAYAHQGAGDITGMENRNTMAAFEAAVAEGYRYLETDVCVTLDGKVIVAHGAANLKEAEATGFPLRRLLEGMSWAQIQETYPNIPLLAEALDAFPDTKFNIDAKTDAAAEQLPGVILDTGAIDRVCLAAFDHRRVKRAAEILGGQERVCTSTGVMGGVALWLAAKYDSDAAFNALMRTNAVLLQLPHERVDGKMVEIAHDAGLEVDVWTTNTTLAIVRSLRQGVDGLMTDRSRKLKGIMLDRSIWR